MKSLLSFLIASLIGATVIVNGVSLRAEDITNETQRVVNEANIHQIRTVLEVYYINEGHYPDVLNREEMLEELLTSGYIYKTPVKLASFLYSVDDQGESYVLNY